MEIITGEKWKKLQSLAKSGDTDAQWEVGYYYEYGAQDKSRKILVRPNFKSAQHWFELAAKQGNAAAQGALSNLLSSEESAYRNDKAAIYWAKKAIDQGDASAAFNLGRIYRDQKKPAMAFRWYGKALSMGDQDALLDLGLCSLFGFGTKQNIVAACKYFEQIIAGKPTCFCQRTIEDAYYWRAVLSLIGFGKSKRSIAQARAYLQIANADDDHEQANAILNVLGKIDQRIATMK